MIKLRDATEMKLKGQLCMKKTVIAVITILVVAGVYILWPSGGHGQTGGGHSGAVPPVEVIVQTIRPAVVSLYQDLPGRTQAFKIAEIRPQVSGIVTKRLFEEGSDVTEGQQLYQIDPASYQAAYDRARADLQKAYANVKAAQAKQARYVELVKIGGVSKQQYDDADAALAQGRADVAIAKAAVASAKINLDYTRVLSPIAGRIGKSSVTEGALVTAAQGDALSVVQQLDKIYVDVTQSIADQRKMRHAFGDGATHLSATLTIEGENEPYAEKGVLQFSDVTVDQGTGTVSMRILFENPHGDLLPGMFVKVRVRQGEENAAILAPQKAVTRNADGSTTVWVVEQDNAVKVRPVTVSNVIGDQWLVTSGLNAGDRIVVEGLPKLSAGASVHPVEAAVTESEAPSAQPSEQQ